MASPTPSDDEAADRHRRRERLRELGERAIRPHAAEVDAQARFPSEALAGFREQRLLGAALPPELGGYAASLLELSEVCTSVAQHCAASGMVMAMHQIQVACLLRHCGGSPYLLGYLRELSERQLLIASVTSEVGIGGDMRSSLAALEPTPNGFSLVKSASTISYGEQADALLVTARRDPAAAKSDQVLVLLRREDYRLERRGAWDTLGMRGTCSPSFELRGAGDRHQILPIGFGEIASATMVPYSHVLWASVWLGIASDAVARASSMVRAQARKSPGSVPPTALRLAEVATELTTLRQSLRAFTSDYEALIAREDGGLSELTSIGFALQVNQLKVSASESAVRIVSQVMSLCGIAGYRNDSRESVGRHLRDVYSSILMIGNDRIHATNAALLLVHKGD